MKLSHLFLICTFFFCHSLIGQDKEAFLSKLDSLGETDSVAKAQMLYNRGVSEMGTEKYNEAIELFNQAVVFNPNFAAIYLNRGLSLLGS